MIKDQDDLAPRFLDSDRSRNRPAGIERQLVDLHSKAAGRLKGLKQRDRSIRRAIVNADPFKVAKLLGYQRLVKSTDEGTRIVASGNDADGRLRT